jgi:hypothetical protein
MWQAARVHLLMGADTFISATAQLNYYDSEYAFPGGFTGLKKISLFSKLILYSHPVYPAEGPVNTGL